jgi:3-oxoacyl-[acyl-carrier protein] reductase
MSAPDRPAGCALVTGGSRGIGAAIADRLRADGWDVVTLSRNGADVQADVSDPEAVKRAFDEVEAAHGPVLCLVNNAGARADGLAIRMSPEQWEQVIDVNLTGAFHCTRRALDSMLRARYGRIVNVSSIVAERANPGQANYAASKAGLLALTRSIAKEMARKGITCNAVTPGLIETDMTADVAEQWLAAVPAGRIGRPEEVAAAVAFLCSQDASYVNGATLAVDGALAA